MVSRRRGHSLPELLVALTVLGTTLAGVATAALTGSRWTRDAALRQQALAVAEAALDSLLQLTAPPGSGREPIGAAGLTIAWESEPLAGEGLPRVLVTVRVLDPGGAGDSRLPLLQGLWIPPVPGPLP